ncbi:hypothetical protein F5Y16DRAFT_401709 [Xylariaceae sp. FL0255]|nr:hypothetical protein F5Y16DRAFT_401709 [Xylariaceae sp. FL0255]
MPSQPDPWLLAAFESAQVEFNTQFPAADRIDFSQYQSIENVYDTTSAIQAKQSKSTTLRGLNRSKPYLECLAQFQGVIEQFVSSKPDLLALIWAPIRLALESAGRLVKAFELLVDALGTIGLSLPHFEQFHVTFLKFLRKPQWELFFESLWPKTARKVDLTLQKINQHKMKMTSEVTLENISQEVAARQRDYIEFERIQEHEALQNFRSFLAELAPCLYDKELKAITRNLTPGSGEWLAQRAEYMTWTI